MELILIRHGESEGNQNHVIYGWTDYPLTPKGLEQVNQILNYMRFKHVDRIYSSPLIRAKYIAQHILEVAIANEGILFFEDERLKEMHCGIFEGMTQEEALLKYSEQYNRFMNEFETYAIPEGESYPHFKERVLTFLKSALPSEDETFVFVAHAGVIREILTYLLQLEPGKVWDYPIFPGCIVTLEATDGLWRLHQIQQT